MRTIDPITSDLEKLGRVIDHLPKEKFWMELLELQDRMSRVKPEVLECSSFQLLHNISSSVVKGQITEQDVFSILLASGLQVPQNIDQLFDLPPQNGSFESQEPDDDKT